MAAVTLLFFVLDRILKYLFYFYHWGQRIWFINIMENRGIAFGIQLKNNIFYIIIFIIIILLSWQLISHFRDKKYKNCFYLSLILFGAASNIIDRIKYGFVVDFIDIWFWPVFNLADIMIVAGCIMIMIQYLKSSKQGGFRK